MPMNNFLIVGFGSSGTRFLAETLNRSQYIEVAHEDNPFKRPRDVKQANTWYERRVDALARKNLAGYGDVNGFLRYRLREYVPGWRKAIILRDWRDILKSWAWHWGRERDGQWETRILAQIERRQWLRHVEQTVRIFEEDINAGIQVIDFSRMTGDVAYLSSLCFDFGAIDVQITPDVLAKKVNEKNRGRVEHYEEIPRSVRQPFDKITAAFNEKYILPYVLQ